MRNISWMFRAISNEKRSKGVANGNFHRDESDEYKEECVAILQSVCLVNRMHNPDLEIWRK